ncbi:4-hydroxy-tetrahydrodipicolinate synthase [Phaeovulum sp.]|uniref:4-hydroxy-tetrahydrodipicolinate synthase n=1 Tax=Phaeovulum sp. TaxID=2934796 RepID=UPI00272F8E6B|nr:4-hydroxy-tetrahydrodipicolinate synthase [Phaeovulum sp.]MDP1667794.1 4-hydroxy-tetrahydrodipicolinate synthase [Phaeovulum sp.]MDZ4118974.1 4-hydroxy-tetrahydrodipicolinate synthase [Phaeovulum sp.]
MTTLTRFDGVFTALVTPFTATGAIDWAAFDRHLDRQLAAGIAGLVPVGTTGEAATLDEDEALALISRTKARAEGAAYVLAGTGSNSTAKTVAATRRAVEAGVDGVLVVTPYYNKPTQAGLVAHFAAVAEAAGAAEVMLYSVPGRAGVAIAPQTAAELAARAPNIVAIKEAGGDAARVTALRAACGADFVVHCGDDGLALPFFALGARGLTSVLSNYAPAECVALWQAWFGGRFAEALMLHERLAPLAAAMFIESSPAPVKHALAHAGLMGAGLRLPLVGLAPASAAALATELARFAAA